MTSGPAIGGTDSAPEHLAVSEIDHSEKPVASGHRVQRQTARGGRVLWALRCAYARTVVPIGSARR